MIPMILVREIQITLLVMMKMITYTYRYAIKIIGLVNYNYENFIIR